MKVDLTRPREKEIVVETQTVMDHAEVNRLTAIIHSKDVEIANLLNRPA